VRLGTGSDDDGTDLLTEITASTTVQTLHGPVIDKPLARNGLFFTPNHLGSTTTLTDITGAVQQSYSYSPFGETTGSGTVANPFQFTGRENDDTGLMYYRARYYRPDWGRFVSEDPIGVLGGINRYAYVENNPVISADPNGKFPFLVVAGIALFLWLASERAADTPAPGYQHRNVICEIDDYLDNIGKLGYGGIGPPVFGGTIPDPPGPPSIYDGLTQRQINQRFIPPQQNSLIRKFLGRDKRGAAFRRENFEVPEGLTREALEGYAELARRAIAAGKDKEGLQVERLELILKALQFLK
jgi:RHS repeat-associated protein